VWGVARHVDKSIFVDGLFRPSSVTFISNEILKILDCDEPVPEDSAMHSKFTAFTSGLSGLTGFTYQ
jgi:hypothetical protein